MGRVGCTSARPWRIIFKLLTGYEENQNLIISTGEEKKRVLLYRFIYTAVASRVVLPLIL